ncbi:MAG: rhodanese-like domain-containing protein [Chitinophagales bacterium]
MKTNIIILALLLGFSACNEAPKNPDAVIQNVETKEFAELIKNDGHLIDVRTPGEFDAGHINGATLINVNDANFNSQIEVLEKSKPVYVYCRSGARSMKAARIMEQKGFTKVYNLKGGYLDWSKQAK